jgi:hypothetical protein
LDPPDSGRDRAGGKQPGEVVEERVGSGRDPDAAAISDSSAARMSVVFPNRPSISTVIDFAEHPVLREAQRLAAWPWKIAGLAVNSKRMTGRKLRP